MKDLSKLKEKTSLRLILSHDTTREEIMRVSVDNPKIVQSYLLTSAKCKFTLWERRIVYAIVEALQPELDGQILKGKVRPLYALEGKKLRIFVCV